ncbi:AEC family transporter [Ammoniphilus sp. CFH 90114]|uniref:AEC family transporter n=1 Tax=Ammoniphilus sp. CFH 90114 TaxID=2493665 RepID=UPI00100F4232|nr:AEC family transporter [Ammoniphilus sp. CFH 90114]RXT07810.1 AEC family transporter [Ammoniphilus sp. CFH 90114]
MGEFSSFFQELLVLYSITAIGIAAKKSSILDPSADRAITQLVLYITLPALILYSMDFPLTNELVVQLAWLLFLSCLALGLGCMLAWLWVRKYRLPESRQGVFQGLMVFGNQGFLGYAICFALLAESGIAFAALFNLPFLVLIWTYGIYLMAKSKDSFSWKTLCLNPGVLATLGGLLFLCIPAAWPSPFSYLLHSLGSTTIPLSMVLLGSLLGNLRWEEVVRLGKDQHLWVATGVKLLLLPLLLFPFTYLGVHPEVLMVAVLLTGMPSAPTTPLFAQKYGGDASFGSIGVMISTVLAFVTIPLLYLLLVRFS